YTGGLLTSTPTMEMDAEDLDSIPEIPPNSINPPACDPFAYRNRYALKIDFKKLPPFFKVSDPHYAATWLFDKQAPKVHLTDKLDQRRQHYAKLAEKEAHQDD